MNMPEILTGYMASLAMQLKTADQCCQNVVEGTPIGMGCLRKRGHEGPCKRGNHSVVVSSDGSPPRFGCASYGCEVHT